MGIFQQFPYSNFHEMNLDQILKIMREMQDEWENTKSEWASYKEFIDNYFANLDLDEETEKALRKLIGEGELTPIIAAQITAWLEANIEPTTPPIDKTLTVEDAAADAKVVGDYFYLNGMEMANNHEIASMVAPTLFTEADFEQGAFLPDGTPNPDIAGQTTRVRMANFIKVKPNTTYIFYMYEECPFYYSASFYPDNKLDTVRISASDWNGSADNDSYLINTPAGCEYLKMTLRKSDGSADITPAEVKQYSMGLYESNTDQLLWSKGTMYATYSGIVRANAGISSLRLNNGVVMIPKFAHATIKLYSDTDYIGKIRYDDTLDKVAGNWKFYYNYVNINEILETYAADNAKFLMVTIVSDSAAYPINAGNYKEWAAKYTNIFTDINIFRNAHDNYNSYVDASMISHPVMVDKTAHRVSGYQACCVYDNKYYSTDGNNLYEQDSDFNLLSTTPMVLGHGNTMQMGLGSHCYVSGWDSDQVYVVDLATKAIVDTITLPLGAYNIAAIDEENNIAYIIYRASLPDTVAVWEFIKYDITNTVILDRKYIDHFAAIQDCDFVDGKIMFAYGLTSTPGGIFVYDTNGSKLCEYNLSSMNGVEYEGIFYDHTERCIKFTDVNGYIYSIK